MYLVYCLSYFVCSLSLSLSLVVIRRLYSMIVALHGHLLYFFNIYKTKPCYNKKIRICFGDNCPHSFTVSRKTAVSIFVSSF